VHQVQEITKDTPGAATGVKSTGDIHHPYTATSVNRIGHSQAGHVSALVKWHQVRIAMVLLACRVDRNGRKGQQAQLACLHRTLA